MQIEDLVNQLITSGSLQQVEGTIPVVVHILYKTEEQRISPEQVYSQIEALNQDFNERNTKFEHQALQAEGFADLIETVGIQFCLASRDEYGRGTSGIVYHPTEISSWRMDDRIKLEEAGGAKAWNTERFLNIWVADLEESVSGYAQMPGGEIPTDGIVIDYNYFGIEGTAKYPFDGGKTLTHLLGNYLGLYSLWGYEPCTDDYVADTPIHNDPNFGCFEYKHITTCNNNVESEMTMNFMDSSNDACAMMFTKGQVERIHAFLSAEGPRSSLLREKAAVQCEEKGGTGKQSLSTAKMIDKETELAFYPNPVHTTLHIDLLNFKDSSLQLKIYNASGQIVYQRVHNVSSPNTSLSIDSSNWISGIYMINTESDTYAATHRIVVSK